MTNFAEKTSQDYDKDKKVTAEFKAKVAIEAIKERESLTALAARFEVAPSVITKWKDEFLASAGQVFEKPSDTKKELRDLRRKNEKLMSKVGQLVIDCDFFAKACEDAGLKVR